MLYLWLTRIIILLYVLHGLHHLEVVLQELLAPFEYLVVLVSLEKFDGVQAFDLFEDHLALVGVQLETSCQYVE